MEAVVKNTEKTNDKTAMDTLLFCLDKGIDDMEAGRVHTVEEAFGIVRDRMKNEI